MPKRTSTPACAAALLAILSLVAGCGGHDGPRLSDAAERGRATFAAFCASCHNYRDPFTDGQTGPAIARSSEELLHHKVLFGKYPAGYTPKRSDPITMVALPHLKDRIGDLTAFLAEIPDPDSVPGPDQKLNEVESK